MWRGTAICSCQMRTKLDIVISSENVLLNCFMPIRHALPLSQVQARCWDNCLCCCVLNLVPPFSPSLPIFRQLPGLGYAWLLFEISECVLSMTSPIAI